MSGDTLQQQQQLKNVRSEEFVSIYANNVVFEPTAFDLKMVFGETDVTMGGIEQHTAITVPWSLAKLLLYYIAIHVMSHEITNGKIQIVPALIPAPVQPPPEEHKDNSTFQRVYRSWSKLREDFVKSLGEPSGTIPPPPQS